MARQGYLYLNYTCNNDCIFCASDLTNGIASKRTILLAEVKDELIRISKSFDKLLVSGGEPTTHKHIFEILIFAASLFSSVNLATNGLLLSNYDFAERLIASGISGIAIPFYHTDKTIFNYLVQNQSAYQQVNSALENLRSLKSKYIFRINMKLLINRENYTNNPDIVSYLEESLPELDSITLAFLRISEKVLKNKEITIGVRESRSYNTETIKRILKLEHELKLDHVPLCGIDANLVYELIDQGKINNNQKISTIISPIGVIEKRIIDGHTLLACQTCKVKVYCPKFPKKNAHVMDYENQVEPYL